MSDRGPRVLVLGGAGMLGHKLTQTLAPAVECWATVRGRAAGYGDIGIFNPQRLIDGVEATNFDTVVGAMGRARPDIVINCVGILKQLPAAQDPIATIQVNALFPHRLALLCSASGAWLIHVSTDCVFSGRTGGYVESDVPDAGDLYGRTKLLGEPSAPGVLVIRTSMIGRELRTRVGLAEWFIANRGGRATGYRRARFSGLTTIALARVVAALIDRQERLTGLYHVGSAAIDKHDLLCRLTAAMQLGIEVVPDDTVAVDRSLESERFWTTTGWRRPEWPEMIAEMAADDTPYEQWRHR